MKKHLLIAIKIFISLGLVFWLLQRSDLSTIWITIVLANKSILFVAFLVFFLVYWLIAVRWKTILGAQKVEAKTGFLAQSFAISVFFNNFLPSTVGGDIYRMYDSWRLGARKSVAVSVVLIDRVIGLFALLIYAFAASFFVPKLMKELPQLQGMLLAILVVAIILGWTIFTNAGRKFERILKAEHPILRGPLRVLEEISSAFSLFRGRHDVLLKAIGLSLLVQLVVIVHHALIAKALNIEIPLNSMFVIVPLSFLLMTLPISINGIGLRETIFAFFFAAYGISQEQAIAFAWASFGMILIQGMIGGLLFAVRKTDFKDIRSL